MSPDLSAVAAGSALKPFNFAKALRNVAAAILCFLCGLTVVGAVPLALFLMIFCSLG